MTATNFLTVMSDELYEEVINRLAPLEDIHYYLVPNIATQQMPDGQFSVPTVVLFLSVRTGLVTGQKYFYFHSQMLVPHGKKEVEDAVTQALEYFTKGRAALKAQLNGG